PIRSPHSRTPGSESPKAPPIWAPRSRPSSDNATLFCDFMNNLSHPDEEANPWTTLDSRPVYENPWIALREDRVLRPDAEPGIYGVVPFKNRALGVLPVEENGDVWLVGQYRYTLTAYSWEIPEGGGPLDEPAESAARRELREETGLIASDLERI